MAAVTPLKRYLRGLAYWAAGDYLPIAFGGTGGTTQASAQTGLGLGTIATQNASAVAITGGAVDATVVGGSTPANGSFTSLSASGTAMAANLVLQNSLNPGQMGRYYQGHGIQGSTSATGAPIFGVLSSSQSAMGGALVVYDTNKVVTFESVLDDGSGNMAVAGGLTVASAPAAADSSTKVPTTAFLASYTVRVDIAQSLTAAQKTQALSNIGAAPASGQLTRGQVVALALGSSF